MVGKTNAVGGAEPFGYIFVAYPAGSTLGATDWTTAIEAETKTGYYVFPIPYAGTWTVACFDGADYDSSANQAYETVTISAQSPYALVELSYDFVIFDRQEQDFATLKNNINQNNDPNYSLVEDAGTHIRLFHAYDAQGYRSWSWKIPIDLTNYSNLVMVGYTDSEHTYNRFGWDDTGGFKADFAGYATVTNTTDGEITVDISSVSGEKYICFSAAREKSLYVRKVYLKK